MARNRKKWTSKEKFHIVLEILKGEKTQSQITSEYGVHATQQKTRTEQFMQQGVEMFDKPDYEEKKQHKKEVEKLHKVIGQYAVEVDWLKKKIDQL